MLALISDATLTDGASVDCVPFSFSSPDLLRFVEMLSSEDCEASCNANVECESFGHFAGYLCAHYKTCFKSSHVD